MRPEALPRLPRPPGQGAPDDVRDTDHDRAAARARPPGTDHRPRADGERPRGPLVHRSRVPPAGRGGRRNVRPDDPRARRAQPRRGSQLAGPAQAPNLRQFVHDLEHLLVRPSREYTADIRAHLADAPADLVLADTVFFAAGLVHELGGPPWAAYGITALTTDSRDTAPFGTGLHPGGGAAARARNRVLNRLFGQVVCAPANRAYNEVRRDLGLPPARGSVLQTLSPYLHLQGSVPGFEYPRGDLPGQVAFVGRFPAPVQPFDPPEWWSELTRARRVVFVTQGTLETDPADLLLPAIEGLASEDLLVVASTGDPARSSLPVHPLPGNTRVVPYVPSERVLPHVDVMITNGGFGGTQAALAQGVPLVAAGMTQDKREINARIDWAGVGVNLRTQHPSSEQVRNGVRRVLAEPRYRQRAQQLATEYGRYDAPVRAADLLEQMASRRESLAG